MICTPAEVAEHAGRSSLTTAENTAVAAQIALYQAELEGLLGRAVERSSRTENIPAAPSAGGYFRAHYGPVHAVTSVTVGGVALTPSQYQVSRYGIELVGWYYAGPMTVVYDGGWEPPRNVPAKNAVIARTARWLNKRTDDDVGTKASTVEGHSVTWMDDAFTPAELAACSRLRDPGLAG